MKRAAGLRGLGAGLALAVLGWLYQQSHQVDGDAHVRLVGHFEQLRQQDARLGQYVLQARYGLLRNYDPLVTARFDISALLDALAQDDPTDFADATSATGQAYQRLRKLYQEKFDLVEAFKSHASVLRNSTAYLPLATHQLLTQPGLAVPVREALHDLLESVLVLEEQDLESQSAHIHALLQNLKQWMPAAYAQQLQALSRHVDLILMYRPEVDGYTRGITLSATDAESSALFEAYGARFAQRQALADRYRTALAVLAAALMAYVAWTLLALQRARRTLTQSLRELEFQKYALDQHSIVSVADRSGKIVYTNEKFSEISQYSAAELLGQDHRILNSGHHSAEFFKTMWSTIGHGQIWHGEVCNRRKDGTLYWVDSTIVPFLDEAGKVLRYVSIRTDMTQRKADDVALRAAKDAAERALRIKSDFLANMSHEIRTPMNGILGMTDLALMTELSAEQREYLSLVKTSAQALLGVINDILDFSKIESGKMHIEQVTFELEPMLRDLIRLLAVHARAKQLELIVDLAPALPRHVQGDPGRLRQVLMNLISNAIKFTLAGEVTLSVHRLPDAPDGMVRLRFSVRDTGVGIAKDQFKTIFESFTQADTSTTRRFGGTGLGLTISNQLVVLMGSPGIQVRSELGQGSEFYFELDLPCQDHGQPTQWLVPQVLGGLRVLVCDDNPTQRALLAQWLQHWGAHPVEPPEGALLDASARDSAADGCGLVLLDADWPGLDAGALIGLWLKRRPSLRVVWLSGAPMTEQAVAQAQAQGAAAVLTKPLAPSDLYDGLMMAFGLSALVADAAGAVAAPERALRPLRILLAEDNPVNQKLARALLEREGHSVTVAADGAKAVQCWQAQPFDVVLMDVDMPDTNGYQATAQIRAIERGQSRHTPIIAMTAHAMQGARETCLAHGMDGYVSKPINVALLWQELAAWVAPAAPAQPAPAQPDPAEPLALEALPEDLPTLDRHAFDLATGADAQLQSELIELYRTDVPKCLQKLADALAGGDARSVEQVAHSVKGMVSVFGAAGTVAAAQALESMAAQGRPMAELEAAAQRLQAQLRALDAALAA
ncbi:MAG: hypothetical protein Fur007_11620 [Rhodoferax sp.]